jgi:hypothetical protein
VLAVCEAVEVPGRDEPESREILLLKIDQTHQIEQPRAFGYRVGRTVGESDDTALTICMSRPFDLQPEGAVAAYIGDDQVAVVDIRLEAGRDQAAVGAGEYLRFDQHLDEGSERGALNHADRLVEAVEKAEHASKPRT